MSGGGGRGDDGRESAGTGTAGDAGFVRVLRLGGFADFMGLGRFVWYRAKARRPGVNAEGRDGLVGLE
jgi:hypothetical protein